MASTVCRFFLQGRCAAGENCRFSHANDSIPDPQKSNTLCKFFAEGSCKNGQYCQFAHETPDVVFADQSKVYKPVRMSKPQPTAGTGNGWVTLEKGKKPTSLQESNRAVEAPPANAWTTPSDRVDILTNSAQVTYDFAPPADDEFVVTGDPSATGAGEFTADEIAAIANEMAAIDLDYATRAGPHTFADFSSSVPPMSGGGEGMVQWDSYVPGADYEHDVAHYSEYPDPSNQDGDLNGLDADGGDYMSHKLCQFYIDGDCRFADSCRFVHGDMCPHCEKNCLHPFYPEESAAHVLECEDQQSLLTRKHASRGIQCNVCYEDVIEMRRKFGLLNSCSHSFCLECIRSWRTTYDQDRQVVRACPVCRVNSHFITPSTYWPGSEEEKNEITEAYKGKLGAIPCKHFNFGDGACPFGTSCFYAHVNRDGTPATNVAPRKYVDADGAMSAVKEVSLADFW